WWWRGNSWPRDHSNRARRRPARVHRCRSQSQSRRSTSGGCAHRRRCVRHVAPPPPPHGDPAGGRGPSSPHKPPCDLAAFNAGPPPAVALLAGAAPVVSPPAPAGLGTGRGAVDLHPPITPFVIGGL